MESFGRRNGLHLSRFDDFDKSSDVHRYRVQRHRAQHRHDFRPCSEYDLLLVCECLRLRRVLELHRAWLDDHAGQHPGTSQHVQHCEPCRADGQLRREQQSRRDRLHRANFDEPGVQSDSKFERYCYHPGQPSPAWYRTRPTTLRRARPTSRGYLLFLRTWDRR